MSANMDNQNVKVNLSKVVVYISFIVNRELPLTLYF